MSDPSSWINSDKSRFEINPTLGKAAAKKGSNVVNKVDNGKLKKGITMAYTSMTDVE